MSYATTFLKDGLLKDGSWDVVNLQNGKKHGMACLENAYLGLVCMTTKLILETKCQAWLDLVLSLISPFI